MRTKRFWLGCAVFMVVIYLFAVPSYGTLITHLIAPVDDALVDNKEPDTNFGDTDYLQIFTAYMSQRHLRSYIKFPLSEIPELDFVESATLYLYHYHGGWTRPIDIYHVADDNWTQNTITWNNRPLPSPTTAELIASEQIESTEGWKSWDLLTNDGWDYNSDVNDGYVSFLLKGPETGDRNNSFYSSKATNNHPYLEIVIIPEPSILALIGLTGLLLLKRRKV